MRWTAAVVPISKRVLHVLREKCSSGPTRSRLVHSYDERGRSICRHDVRQVRAGAQTLTRPTRTGHLLGASSFATARRISCRNLWRTPDSWICRSSPTSDWTAWRWCAARGPPARGCFELSTIFCCRPRSANTIHTVIRASSIPSRLVRFVEPTHGRPSSSTFAKRTRFSRKRIFSRPTRI